MNTAIYENMNKYNKSFYETMKGLVSLNNKLAEQVIEQQMALLSLNVEFFTREMKLASEAKGYKETMNSQTEITTDISSKVQGIDRKSTRLNSSHIQKSRMPSSA